jgi:NAD(P)H dehydrogenase (quinone)
VFDWSGVATTHLRPTFFAEWLVYPHFAKEIWAKKKIEFPFGSGRNAPIAATDQGRLIAYILADPTGHAGKIYNLYGPVEMNHAEIAAAMSEVLEVKIEYAPTSIEEFKEKMEQLYKFNPFLTQHLVEVAQDYQNGIFAGTNDVLETITGTPALSVPAFIEKHRKSFV